MQAVNTINTMVSVIPATGALAPFFQAGVTMLAGFAFGHDRRLSAYRGVSASADGFYTNGYATELNGGDWVMADVIAGGAAEALNGILGTVGGHLANWGDFQELKGGVYMPSFTERQTFFTFGGIVANGAPDGAEPPDPINNGSPGNSYNGYGQVNASFASQNPGEAIEQAVIRLAKQFEIDGGNDWAEAANDNWAARPDAAWAPHAMARMAA